MIRSGMLVKEFSSVFQDVEFFRTAAVHCQMAIMSQDQAALEKQYIEMKEIFARLSKEMRELDTQIKRYS